VGGACETVQASVFRPVQLALLTKRENFAVEIDALLCSIAARQPFIRSHGGCADVDCVGIDVVLEELGLLAVRPLIREKGKPRTLALGMLNTTRSTLDGVKRYATPTSTAYGSTAVFGRNATPSCWLPLEYDGSRASLSACTSKMWIMRSPLPYRYRMEVSGSKCAKRGAGLTSSVALALATTASP
jgi:hypothetical protein